MHQALPQRQIPAYLPAECVNLGAKQTMLFGLLWSHLLPNLSPLVVKIWVQATFGISIPAFPVDLELGLPGNIFAAQLKWYGPSSRDCRSHMAGTLLDVSCFRVLNYTSHLPCGAAHVDAFSEAHFGEECFPSHPWNDLCCSSSAGFACGPAPFT